MNEYNDGDLFTLFPVVLVKQTPKAMLFSYQGRDVWIPKSLITVRKTDQSGSPTYIDVPEWFADREILN